MLSHTPPARLIGNGSLLWRLWRRGDVMGEELVSHDRSSYVRFDDRWVPYPFQNNLRHLPPEVAAECLDALKQAPGAEPGVPFSDWMTGVFGKGITRYFVEPYNFKVWATAAEEMSSQWIAERVAVIDYARARRNYEDGRDDLAWGPNNRFVFLSVGGTGEIYRRVAKPLADRIRERAWRRYATFLRVHDGDRTLAREARAPSGHW